MVTNYCQCQSLSLTHETLIYDCNFALILVTHACFIYYIVYVRYDSSIWIYIEINISTLCHNYFNKH